MMSSGHLAGNGQRVQEKMKSPEGSKPIGPFVLIPLGFSDMRILFDRHLAAHCCLTLRLSVMCGFKFGFSKRWSLVCACAVLFLFQAWHLKHP